MQSLVFFPARRGAPCRTGEGALLVVLVVVYIMTDGAAFSGQFQTPGEPGTVCVGGFIQEGDGADSAPSRRSIAKLKLSDLIRPNPVRSGPVEFGPVRSGPVRLQSSRPQVVRSSDTPPWQPTCARSQIRRARAPT